MNEPCPTCGDKTPGHCLDCHGTGTVAWDFDFAQAIPCPTCLGTGTVEQENATVRGVPNPVTSSIPEPGPPKMNHIYDSHIYDGNGNHSQFCDCSGTAELGPPTSPESPQTLGVTAGTAPGTDEGGPGTIEGAAQGFNKIIQRERIEAVKEFAERVKARLHDLPRHRPTNTSLWDGVQMETAIAEVDAELRTIGTGGDDVQG